ncbi:unnamed protein product [Musa banksii]
MSQSYCCCRCSKIKLQHLERERERNKRTDTTSIQHRHHHHLLTKIQQNVSETTAEAATDIAVSKTLDSLRSCSAHIVDAHVRNPSTIAITSSLITPLFLSFPFPGSERGCERGKKQKGSKVMGEDLCINGSIAIFKVAWLVHASMAWKTRR